MGITFAPGHVKHGKAGAKYAQYSRARTTSEYFSLGGTNGDWNYDLRKGIVKFVDPGWQQLVDDTIRMGGTLLGPRGRRGRRAAYVAFDRGAEKFYGMPHDEYAQTTQSPSGTDLTANEASVLLAAAADSLNLTTYSDDQHIDFGMMAKAYLDMKNYWRPGEPAPLPQMEAAAIAETYLDYMLFAASDDPELPLENIYLSVQNTYGVELDEQHIVSLKGMDEDMRKRMMRAIYKEIYDLIKIGTFELCELPDGREPIGSKLVLKVKYKADGQFDKDKARLVALGFLERVGIDFHSTFAPMASLTSVRVIISIAVHHGWPIFHADIPQAFLRSKLDTDIYFKLPKGVNIVDVHDPTRSTLNGLVLRLLRSLYGLKQSPQLWNQELDKFFSNNGFKRAMAETSLYYKRSKDLSKCVLVLCEVDDLVVTGDDTDGIHHFHEQLIKAFAQRDDKGKADRESVAWEPINSFLGIDIKYDIHEGILTMDVGRKIKNMFHEHREGLAKIGTANLPVKTTFNDEDYPEDGAWRPLELYVKKHYASIVGTIIYLHVATRCDITYMIGKCARGMHKPTRAHVNLLISLLKYLKSHEVSPLVFKSKDTEAHKHFHKMLNEDNSFFSVTSSFNDGDFDPVQGFSDADFAKSFAEQRRSTTGYCFFVYGNLVCWKSKLQPLTAKSTHEAELIALSAAGDEGVWLRKLLKEINFVFQKSTKCKHIVIQRPDRDAKKFIDDLPPTPVYCDNKGTVQTINNPVSTAQASKHLDNRYFSCRDHIREGKLRVEFIRTHLNISDFFTKGLPDPLFSEFKRVLMGTVSTKL